MTVPEHPTHSPAEEADDALLMSRLQAGDTTALAPLMLRWEVPTKALIARLVTNWTEAEDLAQETFVRVWQQRDKFRAGAAFRPWLFAIAVNLARNRLRWWRRRPVVALDEWTDASSLQGDTVEGAPALERQERAAAVRMAITALPLPLREAIVLFEYEQLSHAEIATALGATPKAIETRIYRAREKLRHALQALRPLAD